MNVDIESRIQVVDNHYAACKTYIDRLQKLQGDITVQQELAAVVRDQVRTFAHIVQSLQQLADEQDAQSSRKVVMDRYNQGEKQLKSLQASSRLALIESKKRAEEQAKRDRELLFSSRAGANMDQYELLPRGSKGQDESLLRASNNVTEALKRTSTLMQQELEKSAFTTTVLADSSRTVSSTYSEYQNFGSLLNLSKAIITKLEASDWLDRIALLLGLLFFLSVVIYIIKKRTWDVGISWATWLMGNGGKTAAKAATHEATAIIQPTQAASATISDVSSVMDNTFSTTITSVSSTIGTFVEQVTNSIKDEL
ncbi:Sec20-domain-containing protein [Umbelopsis sp. PMI_123]|nr:Sec20-domain-containing protein [Umbelopsis sp. PMI_123]